MIILKGFVTNQNYADNSPYSVAPVGEISTWSLTYTTDKKEYTDPSLPHLRLVGSVYRNDIQELTLDNDTASTVLSVINDMYSFAEANNNYTLLQMKNYLESQNNNITNIIFGNTIVANNVSVPTWISFTILNGTSENTEVRIWNSDDAYRLEFDEYKIVVVPPFEPIDDFYQGADYIRNRLSNITPTERTDRIQAAKKDNPETYLRTYTFDYIDPKDSNNKITTEWTAIIYGRAGDFLDVIKKAFIDYILKNSKHSRTEWLLLLPDLFRVTEFYIIPRWDLNALPEFSNYNPIYSSVVSYNEVMPLLSNKLPFISRTELEQYTNIITHPYRYLQMYIVGGESNIEGKQTFRELFPDYFPAPTTSVDFNRMSQYTQTWLQELEKALLTAESLGIYETPDNGLRRVVINNDVYLAYTYDNVEYFISVKLNF